MKFFVAIWGAPMATKLEQVCQAMRLAAIGVCLVLAPSPTWAEFNNPIKVSPSSQHAILSHVAIDGNGAALIVWQGEDGTIKARFRSATGVLGRIQTISTGGWAWGPQVAMNGAGDALIAWAHTTNFADYRLKARFRSAAGVLGPIQTLMSGANYGAAKLAMNANGEALVVWSRWDGTNSRIQARSRSGTGALGKVQTLSPAGADTLNPQVAIDGDGDALVVWDFQSGSSAMRARSSTGVLGPMQMLSGGGTRGPQVAIDSAGDALVVWEDFGAPKIRSRVRSKSGVVGSIEPIADFGYGPQMALDASGNALVVWSGTLDGGPNDRVLARARRKTGVLGAIRDVSRGALGHEYRVGRDADGDSVVVWRQDDRIRARTLSKTNALGKIQILSPPVVNNQPSPEVAVHADGSALVIWRGVYNSFSRIVASAGP